MLILALVPAATVLTFFSEVFQLPGQFLHRHGRLELAEEASRIKARKTGSCVQSKTSVRNCYASLIRLDDDTSIEVDSDRFSMDPTVAGFDYHRFLSVSTVLPPITHNGTFVSQGLIIPFQDSQNRAK